MDRVRELINRGIVSSVIGSVPQEPRLALVVWARKPPKPPFAGLVSVAKAISRRKLSVYVDDVCSMFVTGKSDREQREMNRLYSNYFGDLGCDVAFSSILYGGCENGVLSRLLAVGSKVTAGEFKQCLPEDKRIRLESLTADELLHALFELTLLDRVASERDSVLVGQFSQAILAAHRNVCASPLSAIVLSRIDDVARVTESIRDL